MTAAIEIDDRVSDAARQLEEAIGPARVHAILARAGANLMRDHLRDLDRDRPNQMGGRRTHYWREVARATSHTADTGAAKVIIDHVGFGLHYFGGEALPVEATYLAIPAVAEAHGKTPGEFELEWQPLRGPKARGALVDAAGAVFYWLVPSVTIAPDPSVLPTTAAFNDAIAEALQEGLARHLRREGGA